MLFLSCFVMRSCTSAFDALCPPVGKGLISWLTFVMSICDVVTFPLISLVWCGAYLYRFLIFAFFFTCILSMLITKNVKGSKGAKIRN